MSDYTAATFDSWPVKIGLLALLLAARYILAVKVRPRGADALGWLRSGLEMLDSAALTLAVVFLLIQPFVAQAFFIPSSSMENTLPTHDRILVSKWIYRASDPKFRDVVVFEAPPAAIIDSGQPPGTFFVKRCIGVPGDIIEVRNRVLFRNGSRVAEPYTKWKDLSEALVGRFSYDMKVVGDAVYSREYDLVTGKPGPWQQNGVIVSAADQSFISSARSGPVPRDCFLMLGDHRNASLDGHVWGFVPRQNVLGKVFAVFWPPTHWGVIDRKSAP